MGITLSSTSNKIAVVDREENDANHPHGRKKRRTSSIYSTGSSSHNKNDKQHAEKLIIIQAVLNFKLLHMPFLKFVSQRNKDELFRYYEELEALKSLMPFHKQPQKFIPSPVATEIENPSPSATYKFHSIIHTSSLLRELFKTERIPEEASTSEANAVAETSFSKIQKHLRIRQKQKIKLLIMKCLAPLLSYTETMIEITELFVLISDCQLLLIEQVIPDFDLFLRSSEYMKLITSLSSSLIKELYETIQCTQQQYPDAPPVEHLLPILKGFPAVMLMQEEEEIGEEICEEGDFHF